MFMSERDVTASPTSCKTGFMHTLYKNVAFQGVAGAYSHAALQALLPQADVLPCGTFRATFEAVEAGEADAALIPVENSTAGRVTDIHTLLPTTPLKIVREYYQPVHHCLLTVGGLAEVKRVYSHPQALSQCAKWLHEKGIESIPFADTAAAAQWVAEQGDVKGAAIASSIAGELYGLNCAAEEIQDKKGNTTRFLLFSTEELAKQAVEKTPSGTYKTALIFQVRSLPAALYKALGGFATNGVNLVKLESYLGGENFNIAEFFVEVTDHIESPAMKLALEELAFYASHIKVLGCYPSAKPSQS